MNTVRENGPLEWQKLAINLIKYQLTDVLVLPGGFGSGKTAINAHIIRHLIDERPRVGLCIANTYSTLKDTVNLTMDEEIPAVYKVKKILSPNIEWCFRSIKGHKSKLLSRSTRYDHEVPGRLHSINADFLWLVEATSLPEKAYTYGLSRLRKSGEDAYYPVIVETNPSNKNNWVYKKFIENAQLIKTADDKSWTLSRKILENIDDQGNKYYSKIMVLKTTTFANPHFPKPTLSQMLNTYSPREVQRLIYGEWNSLEGRVWEYYKIFEVTGNIKKYAQKYDRVFIGVDPGQDHPTAVAFIGFADGVYEVFDEFRESDWSVRSCYKQINLILDKWGIDRDLVVWVDPSGRYWTKEFNSIEKNRHYAYKSMHKGTDPDLNRASQLGEYMRSSKLIFGSHCRNVLQDIEEAVWKKDALREQLDKKKYDPHSMDAVGYAMIKEGF